MGRRRSEPRGLWRVAPLAAYLAGKPQWRTLIDVDALGKAEGKSWVWHGANCLAPEYRRCLVSLSPGGGDADVIREFDMPDAASSSTGGFARAAGQEQRRRGWTATICSSPPIEGEGTATRSGYPRIVKRWTRGTPLERRHQVAEGIDGRHQRQPVRGDGWRHALVVITSRHRLLHQPRVDAAPRRALGRTADPGNGDFQTISGGR